MVKTATFGICTEDSAATWFQNLPPEIKGNCARLRGRFLALFISKQETLWSKERELYSRQQQPNQSVIALIGSIRHDAREIGLLDEQVMHVITVELRPRIYAYIMDREPHDIEQLIELAKRAETSRIGQYFDLQSELRTLFTNVDNLSLNIRNDNQIIYSTNSFQATNEQFIREFTAAVSKIV